MIEFVLGGGAVAIASCVSAGLIVAVIAMALIDLRR